MADAVAVQPPRLVPDVQGAAADGVVEGGGHGHAGEQWVVGASAVQAAAGEVSAQEALGLSG